MMKSFFKKLAFVMALAMVVSMAAPAAAKAYAADMFLAYQKGGAVSELNMKAGSKEDLCFKNAPANWADLTKTWASDNEAVAVVDKNGVVTAIADGTAKVTFTLGDGTAASVTVNVGEAKVYNVTLGNADNKAMTAVELKKDATFDFNFYGIKDWSTSKYSVTWISNAPEVAKVDQKGIVTAVAAGSATVTAAIVNNETGATMNVTPVTVTVPAEKKAETFTAAQTTVTKLAMTFDAKKDVKAEDVAVIMMINGVEAPIPVRTVTCNDNVATVELFSNIIDGVTYKVTYAGETKEFVGSVGDIAYIGFDYWTVEEGDGKAFVSTDEESAITTLAYQLYDANGVNVTDAYDEDAITYEYVLETESDAYEVLDDELIFYEAGAAAVTLTISWTDEDGEETTPAPFTGVVVATRRPSISHSIVEAGFINLDDFVTEDDVTPVESFTTDVDSPFWKNNNYKNSWIYKDGGNFQFAALVKDNRGNELVTGLNSEDEYAIDDEGNTIYPYGYFKFETSNEDVVDVDDEGVLTFWDKGTASIITYFVDTTGEEPKDVFVGATKITVSPERYVATYKLNRTSATVASKVVGDDITTPNSLNAVHFVIAALDQYGNGIALENGAGDITIKTTSTNENFPIAMKDISDTVVESTDYYKDYMYDGNGDIQSWVEGPANCTGWWCDDIGAGGVHYHFELDGDDFFEYLGKDSSKTMTYAVSIDKEENDKLTTGTTKFKFTVKDTETYADDLAADGVTSKYYYSVSQNKTSVDLVADYIKNFEKRGGDYTKVVKEGEVSLNYLNTTNGYTMVGVPATKIVDLHDEDAPKTGEAGKLYVKITAPKDAYDNDTKKNWDYSIIDGKIKFTWNAKGSTIGYAANGAYKVTVYYVKNTAIKDGEGKLSTLGTYTFTTSNSQAAPKFVGYDDELGNKTDEILSDDMTAAEALPIVKENLVFTYEGKVIDWDDTRYQLVLRTWDVTEKKIRVDLVDIIVPIDDEENSGCSYRKNKIKVGKSIYYDEDAE